MGKVSDIPTGLSTQKRRHIRRASFQFGALCAAMSTAPQTLGRRIKELRKQIKGLSVHAVADAVGLSRSHLSMIENDHDLPGRELLAAIAAYFHVSTDYLLDGRDTPAKPPSSSEVVDDPDELALLNFWRSLDDGDRKLALKMLRSPQPK